MRRVAWILGGLVAGFGLGLLLRWRGEPSVIAVVQQITLIGQLWLNALRMTLVPLIFCLMANGVAAVIRQASAGRIVGITLGLFALLLTFASTGGALLSLGVMALWPPVEFGAALLKGAAAMPATPSFADQLLTIIPVNPIAAAAEAAMTPLIVFAAIFGAATTRLGPREAETVTSLIKGVGETMLVIIDWVLRLAPVGVFLLALQAALGIGLGLAASMIQYVALLSIVLAGAVICAMLLGIVGGGVAPARFLRAASPPLAIAASTQSSMACLPALLVAARDRLVLPAAIVETVIPLAVSTFRFGNVFGGVAAGLIGARLCGLHPDAAHIVFASLIAVLTNVGIVGLPGSAVLFAAYGPIFAVLGAPFELLTLLIAVFALPDILDTSANVAADLSVAAIVSRLLGRRPSPDAEEHSFGVAPARLNA